MISRGFIKNSFIYTIANALPMASGIILLPFYIHYLSTESFGAFSIYLAFALLIQIIVAFSFDTSVYIHYHEYKNDKEKLSKFISSAFLLMLVIGLLVVLVLTFIGHYLFLWIFEKQSLSFFPYGFIAVFIGVFQSFFKVYSSLLQTRQKPELYFRSNLLSFFLIAGLTILGLQIYPNALLGPIGGRLLASIISGSWAMFSVLKEFGFCFNYPILRSSFSFNTYSFIYQLQQWMMNYFDRILISFFLPLSDVGIYGFTMSFLIAIEVIINGLNTSFTPKVVSIIIHQPKKESTLEINRYYYGLTAAAMILVSLCILVFPVVIQKLVHKHDYQFAIQYIPYVALIYLFKSMRLYFGIPYGILKYTKPLPVIYLAVAGLKIIGLVVLIKYFGIYGVIISSLLSYWLEIILLYKNGKTRFSFKYNTFKLLLAPISLAIMIGLVENWLGSVYPIYIHSFYLISCLVLLGVAFRYEVKLINPFKILRS